MKKLQRDVLTCLVLLCGAAVLHACEQTAPPFDATTVDASADAGSAADAGSDALDGG